MNLESITEKQKDLNLTLSKLTNQLDTMVQHLSNEDTTGVIIDPERPESGLLDRLSILQNYNSELLHKLENILIKLDNLVYSKEKVVNYTEDKY